MADAIRPRASLRRLFTFYSLQQPQNEAVAAASAAAVATAAAGKGGNKVAGKAMDKVTLSAPKKGGFNLLAVVQTWPKASKHLLAGAFSGGASSPDLTRRTSVTARVPTLRDSQPWPVSAVPVPESDLHTERNTRSLHFRGACVDTPLRCRGGPPSASKTNVYD